MTWTDEDADRLKKLAERLERDPSFSAEDAAIIHEMIMVYRGLRAWGRGTRFLIVGLAAVAAAVTSWEVITEKVRTWLGGS